MYEPPQHETDSDEEQSTFGDGEHTPVQHDDTDSEAEDIHEPNLLLRQEQNNPWSPYTPSPYHHLINPEDVPVLTPTPQEVIDLASLKSNLKDQYRKYRNRKKKRKFFFQKQDSNGAVSTDFIYSGNESIEVDEIDGRSIGSLYACLICKGVPEQPVITSCCSSVLCSGKVPFESR